MDIYFHSVRLDQGKCQGCVNCIKKCPTEAIRVRNGKAQIIPERCIDCGECIRVCPNKAQYVETGHLAALDQFKYTIALPPPSLYGQFRPPIDPEQVLAAFLRLGFDDVFEEAVGAEVVAQEIRRLFSRGSIKGPLISSACPAVVRLIQVRFPELTERILPINSPTEVAAELARRLKAKELGLDPDEIGVFFITPCAAKVTSIKAPVGGLPSNVNGVLGINKIYGLLHRQIKATGAGAVKQRASRAGIAWGVAGGQQKSIGLENCLVVDGIHNIISVLEEVEMGRLQDIDYIEALACTGGCISGLLQVENSFVARVRLHKLAKNNFQEIQSLEERWPELDVESYQVSRIQVKPRPIVDLDRDISKAVAKMAQAEKVAKELPGLDCGACGAPNCKALAEDIVLGHAQISNCIFVMRDRIMRLAHEVLELAKLMPSGVGRFGGIEEDES